MRRTEQVLIVGGGVIGAACAHYLVRAGRAVTIIDRGTFAGACSHANCGLISPSHVLPLALPGGCWAGFMALMLPGGPLSIRFRFDVQFWDWLLAFARRCNETDMLAAAQAIQPLLLSSLALYRELVDREGLACEWEEAGLLYPYRTRSAFEDYAATNALLRDKFDEGAERIGGEELERFEPALQPGLAGGWFYPHDAHLRPDRLLDSWRARLTAHGVEIREYCELRRLVPDGEHAVVAETSHGPLAARHVVIATGSWTPLLADAIGCRLPIEPGKGFSLTMSRPKICPRRPLIFPEHRVAVTPFASGFRLGSTMQLAGYDATLDEQRLAYLGEAAALYLKEPGGERIEERWYGWRPMTTDSVPVIGGVPGWSNVYFAAGHNMLGLSMAPATGKLVAELVCGAAPHLDPRPYRAARLLD